MQDNSKLVAAKQVVTLAPSSSTNVNAEEQRSSTRPKPKQPNCKTDAFDVETSKGFTSICNKYTKIYSQEIRLIIVVALMIAANIIENEAVEVDILTEYKMDGPYFTYDVYYGTKKAYRTASTWETYNDICQQITTGPDVVDYPEADEWCKLEDYGYTVEVLHVWIGIVEILSIISLVVVLLSSILLILADNSDNIDIDIINYINSKTIKIFEKYKWIPKMNKWIICINKIIMIILETLIGISIFVWEYEVRLDMLPMYAEFRSYALSCCNYDEYDEEIGESILMYYDELGVLLVANVILLTINCNCNCNYNCK